LGELDNLIKLQSRLRMVANGEDAVNATRAAISGCVKIAQRPMAATAGAASPTAAQAGSSSAEAVERMAQGRAEVILEAVTTDERGSARKSERGKQGALSDRIDFSVFVFLNNDRADVPKGVGNVMGHIATAIVSQAALPDLDRNTSVRSIELAEALKAPNPVVARGLKRKISNATFDQINARWKRLERFNPEKPAWPLKEIGPIGENVLVGIVDVGGLDFAHPDFMDNGKSRVVAIWDQGGDTFAPPPSASGDPSANGSEITAEHIDYALKNHSRLKVAPYDLAPQSQQVVGSHATHVASIAAGNNGVCRRAKIAGVMISLPDSEDERRLSFYDTGRIVAGVQYLFDVADREKCDAIAINISLGTNGGAHDGSELMSRWLDHALYQNGRVVCVAAGNSGQESPRFEGDIGHFTGRVHTKGRIPANGLMRDLEWIVLGNGVEDISENELEIWYSPSDELAVMVKPPGGAWIGPVSPFQRIENLMLPSNTFVSIYNELNDPKNGDNKISIYLSPFLKEKVIGIQAGAWRVRLIGLSIRDGNYDAWIERDDPAPISSRHWRLPSFFGESTFVDQSTVSSLACGPRVIGVANLDEAKESISASSSQGPTRDGRTKPDIAAPGTSIVAAKGFDPNELWVEMSGTSMASPYVCGVAGLMLSIAPHLTAAQIAGIMRRTSKPLPGGGYEWHNASGFGVIDPFACLKGVGRLLRRVDDITDKPMKGSKR